MYGTGLLKGMAITLKYFLSRKITVQYPERCRNCRSVFAAVCIWSLRSVLFAECVLKPALTGF